MAIEMRSCLLNQGPFVGSDGGEEALIKRDQRVDRLLQQTEGTADDGIVRYLQGLGKESTQIITIGIKHLIGKSGFAASGPKFALVLFHHHFDGDIILIINIRIEGKLNLAVDLVQRSFQLAVIVAVFPLADLLQTVEQISGSQRVNIACPLSGEKGVAQADRTLFVFVSDRDLGQREDRGRKLICQSLYRIFQSGGKTVPACFDLRGNQQ